MAGRGRWSVPWKQSVIKGSLLEINQLIRDNLGSSGMSPTMPVTAGLIPAVTDELEGEPNAKPESHSNP